MQHITYRSIALALSAGLFIAGCKPKLDAPEPTKGDIDVTNYVAIGNSITSGFADAALYYDGQMVSYPNLLAEQFKQIGGGEFRQPLVPQSSPGIGSSGNARSVLGYKTDCKGVTGLSPVPFAQSGDLSIFTTNIAAQGPFNNMGVPGAKAIHMPVAGYGAFNPFFKRMIDPSELASQSMLSKAAAQNPTFFSVFIGNNDVLAYALLGGAGDAVTPSAGPPGYGFDASYDLIINTMTANGAKGIVGSIPDVTGIPFATTIPYNGLTLDATQAAGLNANFAAVGATFHEGPGNAFMILDSLHPAGVRQIQSNEYILLTTPQDSLKCGFWGTTKPLKNKYVLTQPEVIKIQAAVEAYNAKIKSVAAAKGLAYVDVNAFMAKAKTGIVYNGITTSATFVSGGAFSLDGIHLTPRANALLANEFIKAINSQYGSGIPQIDATKYNGVTFP